MASRSAAANERGRRAERPGQIPPQGWLDVLMRVKDELNRDHMSMAAAGVAFYALLALFPAIISMISIYGLVFDPADVERQMQSVMGVMPEQAASIIQQRLSTLVSQSSTGLGWGAALGVLFALWSAAKGVKAVMKALNMAYDEDEKRGFIKLNAVALALTLVSVLFTLLALTLIAILPAVVGFLGLPSWMETAVSLARWPILLFVVLTILSVFYRYAPSRQNAQWRWVSWGAAGATLLWILGSILFSFYVSNFGSYNETYGSLGAVVVLLMWLWLSSYIMLLGAEVNAELEHQTERDTTDEPDKPLGARGAYVADTVGKKR